MLKGLELLILFLEVGNHLLKNKARFIYNPVQMILPNLDL
jgi:hypothetical protein